MPSVRGVCNYIKCPGAGADDGPTQRVLQPRIGQEVFASDMVLGRVERVIINPDNRRVEATVVHGQMPDRLRATPRMRSYDRPLEERHVVIPIAEISSMTPTVMQLSISGLAAAGRADFAPGDFRQPDQAWRPPYPYVANQLLWTKR